MFDGHCEEWNERRLKVILKHVPELFFKEKKVLEVGCGHAFFSKNLKKFGADVTASDARIEYLKNIKNIKTITHDLDQKWTLGEFDVIIHFGVLYHLRNPKLALQAALENSSLLILESEVLSSMKDEIILREEEGYDQAYNRIGNQLSVGAIEEIFKKNNKKFKRIDDPELNSSFHNYDWEVKEDLNWVSGRRKFWIVGE